MGANKELQKLVSLLGQDKINDAICNQGSKWHINPPLAFQLIKKTTFLSFFTWTNRGTVYYEL